MTDWRTQYEDDATAERQRLERMTDAQLLALVARRETNGYHGVWHVLGARPASAATCWALYGVLQGDWAYLDRYHCAAALLRLLGMTDAEPVAYSAEWPVVTENRRVLRQQLVARFGEPGR